MGREVRRVPKDWEHPKDSNGNYIPLLEGPFSEALAEWLEEEKEFNEGFVRDYSKRDSVEWKPLEEEFRGTPFVEWAGRKPEENEHMPGWTNEERTHYQMYENCTEGTPISPVMETAEELARWLVDNDASAFVGLTATYEQWLSAINAGYAPSLVICDGVMKSGVEDVGNA